MTEFNSVKDLYFLDLQHTRELYTDFDLKLRVLYVLMKEPYGMSVKQIIRRLGGKYDSQRTKVKNVLAFWSSLGVVYIGYDHTMKTFPSPMMWECNVEMAEEILTAFEFIHKTLVNKALRNGSIERLVCANKTATHCISM
jgi:hypothetical protein